MDANKALCTRAEALDEACWQRLERKPRYQTLTEETRERYQANEKERIIREREFVNLKLNYEDVAEFDYQPRACQRPTLLLVAYRTSLLNVVWRA